MTLFKSKKNQALSATVIGTGKISEEHLRFLGGYRGARLAGVCDLSPSMAKFAADRAKAERFFTSYRQMLDEVKPDVVHVLTPPHTHVPLVKDCLEAGSHVIIEKPVAPTRAEFLDLWSLAQRCGKQLIEDHNYRFNRPVQAIKELVDSGKLGELREIEARMSLAIRAPGGRYADANLPHPSHQLPAGVIHEFVTHLCYLTLMFLPDYDRVTASWNNYGGGDLFKYDDLDALIVGNQCHARVRFSCHTAPDCLSLVIRGSKGWVQTDLFQPYQRLVVPRAGGQLAPMVNQWVNGVGLMKASIGNFKDKLMQNTPYHGLHRFLEQAYEALLHDDEPPIGYEDMDRVSRLIDAMLDGVNQR